MIQYVGYQLFLPMLIYTPLDGKPQGCCNEFILVPLSEE
jgi:hypothetical protein